MRFEKTALDSAYIVEVEKVGDDRGFFGRIWCASEFEQLGLASNICQINSSCSGSTGTIRGLHYQVPPHAETKYIRCTRGSIFCVIIDIRRQSRTFLQWIGVELSATEHKMLYVPEGFANGFVSLEPDTEVYYPVTAYYQPSAERGIRFNDPLFNIAWPVPVTVCSETFMATPAHVHLGCEPGLGCRASSDTNPKVGFRRPIDSESLAGSQDGKVFLKGGAVAKDIAASGLVLKQASCTINTLGCGSSVSGVLTASDCDLGDGTVVDFWEFQGDAGSTVTIDLTSSQFDTFLALLDPTPTGVALDDDGGSGTNARIVHTLDSSGPWTIAANNLIADDLGSYNLSLTCSGSQPTPPAAPSNLTAMPISTTEVQLRW